MTDTIPTPGDTIAIPDRVLHDSRLSFKARGLLYEILADGVEPSLQKLARRGPARLHSIRTGLAELEAVGYVTRVPRPRRGADHGGTYFVIDLMSGDEA